LSPGVAKRMQTGQIADHAQDRGSHQHDDEATASRALTSWLQQPDNNFTSAPRQLNRIRCLCGHAIRSHRPREPARDRTRAIPCPARAVSWSWTTCRFLRMLAEASACSLHARSAGQRRVLVVTPGQPDPPAHLHTGRLARCANRPSEQAVTVHADRRPMAMNPGAKTVSLTGAESCRAKAVSQRCSTSSSTMPSASMASRAAQAGGRIPGGAVKML